MKYATLKFRRTLIIAASALLLSNAVWAGNIVKTEVYVTSTSASGSIRDARYSNDRLQHIGCSVSTATNSSEDYIYCSAKDKAGNSFWCHSIGSSAANFKKALKTVNDYSLISVHKNGDGTCSNLYIENSSFYL